jgi:hypothetical protein
MNDLVISRLSCYLFQLYFLKRTGTEEQVDRKVGQIRKNPMIMCETPGYPVCEKPKLTGW